MELEPHPRYVNKHDGLWKRFHATGTRAYGKAWKDRRAALCGYFTGARTASAKRLYPREMLLIIEHIEHETTSIP